MEVLTNFEFDNFQYLVKNYLNSTVYHVKRMDPIWIWKTYSIYEQILVCLGLVWFWSFQAFNKPVNVTSNVRISWPSAKCGT